MEIKVNQTGQISAAEQKAPVKESDGSFKFTLLSNIEEHELGRCRAGEKPGRLRRLWEFTCPADRNPVSVLFFRGREKISGILDLTK